MHKKQDIKCMVLHIEKERKLKYNNIEHNQKLRSSTQS